MIDKNSHSYPKLDIAKYFDDFIDQRKLFLKKINHSMEYNIDAIQSEVNKIICSHVNLNVFTTSLIARLSQIIVNFESLGPKDIKLIMYLKRYFELHKIIYSELEAKNQKLDINSIKNDINLLFNLSYILQLMYKKTNDFNYLSTSIKINELILNNFESHKSEESRLIKYLINHEVLILRDYNENI